MKILLLDQSKARRYALELIIKSCLEPSNQAEFYGCENYNVFDLNLPNDVSAVFITINSMINVESAKQFAKRYSDIPLVVVGGIEDYSVESYRLNARYYIGKPLTQERVCEALRRCCQ